ncbi:MAG: hypothetical protein LBK58_13590 [Prevotellaceae bacterium]|jgi:hypothetical protein|nr:hypothetical protein [Prevotellaceae bacterium]
MDTKSGAEIYQITDSDKVKTADNAKKQLEEYRKEMGPLLGYADAIIKEIGEKQLKEAADLYKYEVDLKKQQFDKQKADNTIIHTMNMANIKAESTEKLAVLQKYIEGAIGKIKPTALPQVTSTKSKPNIQSANTQNPFVSDQDLQD